MSNYFEKVEKVIKEKRIIVLNIQNMDKFGFYIKYRKLQLVIIISSNNLFYIINPNNYNIITLVLYYLDR